MSASHRLEYALASFGRTVAQDLVAAVEERRRSAAAGTMAAVAGARSARGFVPARRGALPGLAAPCRPGRRRRGRRGGVAGAAVPQPLPACAGQARRRGGGRFRAGPAGVVGPRQPELERGRAGAGRRRAGGGGFRPAGGGIPHSGKLAGRRHAERQRRGAGVRQGGRDEGGGGPCQPASLCAVVAAAGGRGLGNAGLRRWRGGAFGQPAGAGRRYRDGYRDGDGGGRGKPRGGVAVGDGLVAWGERLPGAAGSGRTGGRTAGRGGRSLAGAFAAGRRFAAGLRRRFGACRQHRTGGADGRRRCGDRAGHGARRRHCLSGCGAGRRVQGRRPGPAGA